MTKFDNVQNFGTPSWAWKHMLGSDNYVQSFDDEVRDYIDEFEKQHEDHARIWRGIRNALWIALSIYAIVVIGWWAW